MNKLIHEENIRIVDKQKELVVVGKAQTRQVLVDLQTNQQN